MTNRIPKSDGGTPLSVDDTLPAAGPGPLPNAADNLDRLDAISNEHLNDMGIDTSEPPAAPLPALGNAVAEQAPARPVRVAQVSMPGVMLDAQPSQSERLDDIYRLAQSDRQSQESLDWLMKQTGGYPPPPEPGQQPTGPQPPQQQAPEAQPEGGEDLGVLGRFGAGITRPRTPAEQAELEAVIAANTKLLSDIVRGLDPREWGGGPLRAIQANAGFLDAISDWIKETTGGDPRQFPGLGFRNVGQPLGNQEDVRTLRSRVPGPSDIGARDTPETTTGHILQAMTQFATEYVGLGKFVPGMRTPAPGIDRLTRQFFRATAAEYLGFEGNEKNFADLLLLSDNPILNNAATQWLANKQGESEFIARLKNSVAAGPLNALLPWVMNMGAVARNQRFLTHLTGSENFAEAKELLKQAGMPDETISTIVNYGLGSALREAKIDPNEFMVAMANFHAMRPPRRGGPLHPETPPAGDPAAPRPGLPAPGDAVPPTSGQPVPGAGSPPSQELTTLIERLNQGAGALENRIGGQGDLTTGDVLDQMQGRPGQASQAGRAAAQAPQPGDFLGSDNAPLIQQIERQLPPRAEYGVPDQTLARWMFDNLDRGEWRMPETAVRNESRPATQQSPDTPSVNLDMVRLTNEEVDLAMNAIMARSQWFAERDKGGWSRSKLWQSVDQDAMERAWIDVSSSGNALRQRLGTKAFDALIDDIMLKVRERASFDETAKYVRERYGFEGEVGKPDISAAARGDGLSPHRGLARTGKHGSLPEEAAFRKLMGQQYEIAKASGDLSGQYDILGGRLINDRSMPAAMREAMELERVRLAHEMGSDGRKAAGIPDPKVEDTQAAARLPQPISRAINGADETLSSHWEKMPDALRKEIMRDAEVMPVHAVAERISKRVADAAVESGQKVQIESKVIAAIKESVESLLPLTPPNYRVGFLERIAPIPGTRDVSATFRLASGRTVTRAMHWEDLGGSRAFHTTGGGLGDFIGIVRFSAPSSVDFVDKFRHSLRGEMAHELGHALLRTVDGGTRERLFAHAEGLRILKTTVGEYFKAIGREDVMDAAAGRHSLEKLYQYYYRKSSKKDELVREESITIMLEMIQHGHIKVEMRPGLQQDLDALFGQHFPTRAPKQGDVQAAVGSGDRTDLAANARVSETDLPSSLSRIPTYEEAIQGAAGDSRSLMQRIRSLGKDSWGELTTEEKIGLGNSDTTGTASTSDVQSASSQAGGFTTVAYHGTGNPNFDTFDPSKSRWDAGAAWFTDNRLVSNRFAHSWAQREGTTEHWNKTLTRTGAAVIPVRLKTEGFAEVDWPTYFKQKTGDEFNPRVHDGIAEEAALVKEYKERGVPGIILRRATEEAGPKGAPVEHTAYAVFDPTYIARRGGDQSVKSGDTGMSTLPEGEIQGAAGGNMPPVPPRGDRSDRARRLAEGKTDFYAQGPTELEYPNVPWDQLPGGAWQKDPDRVRQYIHASAQLQNMDKPEFLAAAGGRMPPTPPGNQPPAVPGNFSKEFQVNWTHIESQDQLKAVAGQMMDAFRDELVARGVSGGGRGHVQTWEQTAKQAGMLDAIEHLFKIGDQKGITHNAVGMEALGTLYTSSMKELERLVRLAASPQATPETYVQMRHQMTMHRMVQNEFWGGVSEAGRTLNILRKVKSSSQGYQQSLQQIIESTGGVDSNRALAEALAGYLDEGNFRRLDEVLEKGITARTIDAVIEMRTGGLLTGPPTWERNIIGNTLAIPLSLLERKVAEYIGAVLHPVDGVKFGEAAAMAQGQMRSLREGLSALAESWTTGEFRLGQSSVEQYATRPSALGAEAMNLSTPDAWRNRQEPAWGQRGDPNAQPGNIGPHDARRFKALVPGSGLYRQLAAKPTDMFGLAVDILSQVYGHMSFRPTGAPDAFFKVIHKNAELYAQAWRKANDEILRGEISDADFETRLTELRQNPTEDMTEAANRAANYNTWTDENTSTVGRAVQMLRSSEHPAVRLAANVLVPFWRTPSRILNYTFERTPLAPLSAKVQKAIGDGGVEADLAYARMALGTMMLGLGGSLLVEGWISSDKGAITGGMPTKRPLREAAQRLGAKDYSVRVPTGETDGDGEPVYAFIPIQNIGGAADILLWGAMLADARNRMDHLRNRDPASVDQFEIDWDKAMAAAVFASADLMMSKSSLQGVSEFMRAIGTRETTRQVNWSERLAQSFVPASSGLRYVRRQGIPGVVEGDPVKREVTGYIDALYDIIPGLSTQLPPSLDTWGRPVTYESGLGAAFDAFMPFATRTSENAQAIDKELLRLGWGPETPRSISILRSEAAQQALERGGSRSGGPRRDRGLGILDSVLADPSEFRTGESNVVTLAGMPKVMNRLIELRGQTSAAQLVRDNEEHLMTANRAAIARSLDEYGDKTLLQTLNALVKDPRYLSRELTDDQRQQAIKDIIRDYETAAKAQVVREFPELQKRRDAMPRPQRQPLPIQ